MRYRRSYTATLTPGSLPPSDAACDVLDYRSVFQNCPTPLPIVPSHIPPPTLDPYAREAWRGTALLSNGYIYVVVTVLPDANNRSVVNILARQLGEEDDTPPPAPYRDVDDTSRCEPFSLSEASAAADAFEASGLAVQWSAALSLPALGSPTMDPTPALELLTKRNALRNRNRDLSNLTAESPPPQRTKRRVHAPSLPVTSPHVMPATAPLLNLLLAAADTSEVSSSSSPDPPTDGSSVADSLDPSTSMAIDLSIIPSPPQSGRRKWIRSKSQKCHRKRHYE